MADFNQMLSKFNGRDLSSISDAELQELMGKMSTQSSTAPVTPSAPAAATLTSGAIGSVGTTTGDSGTSVNGSGTAGNAMSKFLAKKAAAAATATAAPQQRLAAAKERMAAAERKLEEAMNLDDDAGSTAAYKECEEAKQEIATATAAVAAANSASANSASATSSATPAKASVPYFGSLPQSPAPYSYSPSLSPGLVNPPSSGLSAVEREKKMLKEQSAALAAITEEKNRKHTMSVDESMKKQATVDVAIVIDCTGSMGVWIKKVQTHVVEIIEYFSNGKASEISGYRTRLCVLGFRDLHDQSPWEQLDFTDDAQAVKNFVDKLSAKTVDSKPDYPENILGALDKVQRLDWKARTKIIIALTDAPCHGTQFHNDGETLGDAYPNGDPNGLTPAHVLSSIKKSNIDLFFSEIHPSTKKMQQVFQTIWDALSTEQNKGFTVIPLGANPDKFKPAIIQSITASIKGKTGPSFASPFSGIAL